MRSPTRCLLRMFIIDAHLSFRHCAARMPHVCRSIEECVFSESGQHSPEIDQLRQELAKVGSMLAVFDQRSGTMEQTRTNLASIGETSTEVGRKRSK